MFCVYAVWSTVWTNVDV